MMSERLMEEESLCRDFESLSVPRRLVRSISQKLRKKNHIGGSGDEDDATGVSLRCFALYSRSGHCKVGADTEEAFGDPGSGRRSNVNEEGKRFTAIRGNEETSIDCFSYRRERFLRRNSRKFSEVRETQQTGSTYVFLPDDILEICLVRLPLASLMNARLVCRKWRNLTTTPRFLQLRREGLFQSPWLFLFGIVKQGYCSGEIHALDVTHEKWHKIDAEVLKGRYLFSVASIRDDVYIVGGCSSLTNFGRVDRNSFKTHKGVMVFSPLTKSWRKAASMKHARSSPILGFDEVGSECPIIRNQQNGSNSLPYRSRIGDVSDVYEDPHRLSVRWHFRRSFNENEVSLSSNMKPYKFVRQKTQHLNNRGKRFVLIAVGGLGSWDEPLVSAEIYDPESNKWTEIQRLPFDFGIACSGVICNRMFYVYSEMDKLVAYDIERGYWVSIQTSPFLPRVHEYHPKLICCNDRLFMISVSWCEGNGQIGRRNKAVRKLWELDLIYLTWTEASTHPDAPMDWNAAFVADKNLIFGVEMFKIFGRVLDFFTLFDVSAKGTNWSHISRNHVARELDATSCMTKLTTVLHL